MEGNTHHFQMYSQRCCPSIPRCFPSIPLLCLSEGDINQLLHSLLETEGAIMV